jgi:hypothetical protein
VLLLLLMMIVVVVLPRLLLLLLKGMALLLLSTAAMQYRQPAAYVCLYRLAIRLPVVLVLQVAQYWMACGRYSVSSSKQ